MSKVEKFIPFLFLISSILTAIWFSSGRVLVTGEEGFSIFNKINAASQVSLWQSNATGYPMPVYVNRLVPIVFVKVLLSLSLPLWFIQAVFYFSLVFTGMIFMYQMTKTLLENNREKEQISFIAALFYLLNLYAMSQIINRFLYSSLALWALIPSGLYFGINYVRKGKIKSALYFVLICFFLSIAYLQPAHTVTFWVPILLWVAVEIWQTRLYAKLYRVFVLAFLWLISNFWWLYAQVSLAKQAFLENIELNLGSLMGVSQYFGTSQILLLRQSFLFGINSFWYDFYSQSWVYILSIAVLLIAVFGWVKAQKRKYWLFLTILAVVGWFISKGTNFPFGRDFFEFLFKNFSFTQAFRNPYEKFGFIWLFAYSIFFAVGLKEVYERTDKKIRNFIVLAILVIACGILVWPMWTGSVFPPYTKVSVPSYYSEANKFLDSDKADGRTLMLPIIPGDGVKYAWGYIGVEPSEFLFDRPAISKILRTKYFDDRYWEIEKAFVEGKKYNQFLNETNIKYLILHSDLISEASGASTSAQVKQTLTENPKIHFLRTFGELEIYEYKGNKNPGLFVIDANEQATLDYKKLNATHYVVNVKGAKEPFRFIFKETYNDFWEARIDGGKIENHFLIYNYANGWEIGKIGDYNIEVIFKVWPWE